MPNQVNSSQVAIIDTSILVLILKLPNMGSETEYRQVMTNFVDIVSEEQSTILLPIATIIETGNHISQINDGNIRRECTLLFVEFLERAISSNEPFTIVTHIDDSTLREWIEKYKNDNTEVGFGDKTIIQVWGNQCKLNPNKRVYIWSKDTHLSSYDKCPTLLS